MGRRRRRRKWLLNDLKETRGYCKLKEEAQGRALWTTSFGRGCRLVIRETTKKYDDCVFINCISYSHATVIVSDSK
jgi:hypothetical protein